MTINICRSQGLGRGGFLVLTSTVKSGMGPMPTSQCKICSTLKESALYPSSFLQDVHGYIRCLPNTLGISPSNSCITKVCYRGMNH
jgi:hypothetical protein